MKLYYTGRGKYFYYTVAENEAKAIEQVQEKHNMKHIAITAQLIDDIDGYKIAPIKEEIKKKQPQKG